MKRAVSLLLACLLVGGCGPKLTECRDGTHSSSHGRGTCSGHGGVKETP